MFCHSKKQELQYEKAGATRSCSRIRQEKFVRTELKTLAARRLTAQSSQTARPCSHWTHVLYFKLAYCDTIWNGRSRPAARQG